MPILLQKITLGRLIPEERFIYQFGWSLVKLTKLVLYEYSHLISLILGRGCITIILSFALVRTFDVRIKQPLT